MICPKCNRQQPDEYSECIGCGVIFAKYRPSPLPAVQNAGEAVADNASDAQEDEPSVLRQLLMPIPKEVNLITLAAKAVLWVVLAIWVVKFSLSSVASNYAGESILHLINLPFHEAGHILFSPFGRFLTVLGGSLMQLIMPAVCLGVLLIRTRDAFGASVALWWLAESFMDIAPYINDARDLNLVLLGGFTGKDVADYHDWEYLLGKLGLLRMDHTLAHMSQFLGIVLMATALVWGALILIKSYSASAKDA
jgi:hypothetical protein